VLKEHKNFQDTSIVGDFNVKIDKNKSINSVVRLKLEEKNLIK
jgi:hypothetical protein